MAAEREGKGFPQCRLTHCNFSTHVFLDGGRSRMLGSLGGARCG